VRKDWADYRVKYVPGDAKDQQAKEAVTYRVGAIYELPFGLAPYVSYAESFTPVFDFDYVNGRFFEPETAKQYEVGVKYQPKGADSFVTFAAFDLTRENALTYDPDADVTKQTGEIKTRGIEVEAVGAVTREFDVVATYTYNDAEVTKSTDVDLGKRPYTVPAHMASFWGNYEFKSGALDGFSLGAGVRYIGDTAGDMENTFFVSSYTLADAAIRYEYGGALFAINANNVFDKEFVSVCYSDNSCYYGNRRSVIGSITYKW
jgi:iron complex outermembrane recepter protein